MSSQLDTPLRIAQVLGITLSSFWAGATVSISTFLIPHLISAPSSQAVTSWARMFNLGKFMAPPISLAAATSFGYIAYSLPTSTPNRDKVFWRYVTAAVFSGAVPFYTATFMQSTNGALLREAAKVAGEGGGKAVGTIGEAGVSELLRKWSVLNNLRGSLLIVSACIGAWTALV